MRRRIPLLLGCALIAGCGSTHNAATTTTTTRPSSPPDPAAELERRVRTALQQNARVSDYVLEKNAIPSWAQQSTDGPALAGMRNSAAQRRSGGITVHVLSDEVHVESVQLAPSFTTATARVTEHSRVVPYRHGRALGKAVVGNEHARFALHRASNGAFVVWAVSST